MQWRSTHEDARLRLCPQTGSGEQHLCWIRANWLSGTADGALVYPCIPVPCHPEAVSDIVDELSVGGAVGYHHQQQHRDSW